MSTGGKKAQHESSELICYVQNEDYSPGDSISDSSEKLLQRGGWGGQYICDSREGEDHAIKHRIFAEGCCQSQGGDVTVKDFSALLDTRRYKTWLIKSLLENI